MLYCSCIFTLSCCLAGYIRAADLSFAMHRCPSLLYDAASLALASALRSQHVTARLCWLLRAGWPACGARWCRRLPFSGFQAAASLGELGVGLVDVGPPSRAQRIREVGVASNLLDMPPPDPHPLRARFREAALGYSFAESSAFGRFLLCAGAPSASRGWFPGPPPDQLGNE